MKKSKMLKVLNRVLGNSCPYYYYAGNAPAGCNCPHAATTIMSKKVKIKHCVPCWKNFLEKDL